MNETQVIHEKKGEDPVRERTHAATAASAEREHCLTVQQVAEIFDLNEWTLRMWMNRLEILRYTISPDTGAMMLPPETVHLVAEVVVLTKRGGMTIDAVREHLSLMVSGE